MNDHTCNHCYVYQLSSTLLTLLTEITCTSSMTIKLILFKLNNKKLSLVVYAGMKVHVASISEKYKNARQRLIFFPAILVLMTRTLYWFHHTKKLLFLIISSLWKSRVSLVFNVAKSIDRSQINPRVINLKSIKLDIVLQCKHFSL